VSLSTEICSGLRLGYPADDGSAASLPSMLPNSPPAAAKRYWYWPIIRLLYIASKRKYGFTGSGTRDPVLGIHKRLIS
ncbi:MAG: hypothetical protein WB562_17815, partial [Candidatus Sulfotelmatobacter sp.]